MHNLVDLIQFSVAFVVVFIAVILNTPQTFVVFCSFIQHVSMNKSIVQSEEVLSKDEKFNIEVFHFFI